MHALTTLNSTTYVEAARVLAGEVIRSSGDETARFTLTGQRLIGRNPRTEEVAVWKRSLERAREAFTKEPEAAGKLLAPGISSGTAPNPPGIDAREHAAWTALCLNLLNLDEALTRE
jgi:hypothetical protein